MDSGCCSPTISGVAEFAYFCACEMDPCTEVNSTWFGDVPTPLHSTVYHVQSTFFLTLCIPFPGVGWIGCNGGRGIDFDPSSCICKILDPPRVNKRPYCKVGVNSFMGTDFLPLEITHNTKRVKTNKQKLSRKLNWKLPRRLLPVWEKSSFWIVQVRRGWGGTCGSFKWWVATSSRCN